MQRPAIEVQQLSDLCHKDHKELVKLEQIMLSQLPSSSKVANVSLLNLLGITAHGNGSRLLIVRGI